MKCAVCGKEISGNGYVNGFRKGEFICSAECLHKAFWDKIVSEKEYYIVYNYECYSLGKEDEYWLNKGFEGKKFKVTFNNGKYLITTNLNYCGQVPVNYAEELPNNAISIEEIKERNYD